MQLYAIPNSSITLIDGPMLSFIKFLYYPDSWVIVITLQKYMLEAALFLPVEMGQLHPYWL